MTKKEFLHNKELINAWSHGQVLQIQYVTSKDVWLSLSDDTTLEELIKYLTSTAIDVRIKPKSRVVYEIEHVDGKTEFTTVRPPEPWVKIGRVTEFEEKFEIIDNENDDDVPF